jgi:hypothetical protein
MNDMKFSPDGRLDLISDEGWVLGWAWYPEAPERRVIIEVLADGTVIGSAIANLHREDVLAAGFGDGCYGFSVALPYQVLARKRPSVISVRDQVSGETFPKQVVFSQPALQEVGESLQLLDRDVRLLEAELAHRQKHQIAESKATAALFDTVAEFFSQLAETALAGASPRNLRTLHQAVHETITTYQPLDFVPAAPPALSFCFMAEGELGGMYESLAALASGFSNAQAELLILDVSNGADAPLLPLLAANARYIRHSLDSKPADGFNRLASVAHGEILYFLTAPAKFSWPKPEVLAMAFAEAQLGVLAPRLVSVDDVVDHAGAMFKAGELFVRDARGADDLTQATLVDTAGPWAFIIRRSCWEALGGFDERFETSSGVVADFCLRARQAGWQVLYQPAVSVTLPLPPRLGADELTKASADAIRLGELSLPQIQD